jgi:hypothetical protein
MRKSRKERKKEEYNKRRFSAIKDLMSTFAMSTVAVVAVVTLVPSSPQADITKAVAMDEEIAYQVTVTDEENALDLSSLYVVLENQLEYYEHPATLGENSGYFDNLSLDTQYRLSVYGNKGFGQERLDTVMIETEPFIGGIILSVTPESLEHSTSYNVAFNLHDPSETYTSYNIYYGVLMDHYEYEDPPEDYEPEYEYSSYPITPDDQAIILTDIWTSEPFHIYLEGTTIDGSTVLDEIWVTPPFELYSSIYLESIGQDSLGYHIYSDSHIGKTMYTMNIYKDDTLYRSDDIVLGDSGHEGVQFTIRDLTPNTHYYIECVANYKNPQTLRNEEKIIYEENITTLEPYSYTYNKEENSPYLDIEITLNDPSDLFQYVYYEVYDTTGEYRMYINSESNYFMIDGDNKTVSFRITIPDLETYEIIISLRNNLSYTTKEIIERITKEAN